MTRSRSTQITLLTLGLLLAPGAVALAQDEGAKDEETSAEAAETEDEAAEEKKKLSDRIKSVQRKTFLKRRRVEIYPHFALDLNDPFFQHLIVGASVGFHVVDSLAIELRGGYAFASLKQDAIRFVRERTDSLLENPPEFRYHADADLTWAPFYGKVSLMGEGILHFDTFITTGVGVFGTDGEGAEGVNPAINIGIGQRYFLTDWLVARVELRDYIFIDERNNSSDVQNLLVLGLSVSGFFPTSFEYEFQ